MDKLLAIHKKLLDFVDTDLTHAMHGKIKTFPGLKDHALFIFAKSTKTYRAIEHLCNKGIGYGEDAIILSRSLLENLINLAYISNPHQEKEREHHAKLFVNWLIIDLKRKRDALPSNDPIRPQLEQYLKEYENIGVNYDEINKLHQEECNNHKTKDKQSDKRFWSGLSIKNMAEEIGLLDPYYNKVYWMYSKIAHPHPGGSSSYMKPNPDGNGIIIDDTPNPAWIEDALVSSLDCYIRLVGLINNIFDLKLDSKLKEIDTEAANLIKTL